MITIAYAYQDGDQDGTIRSSSTSYSAALNGTGTFDIYAAQGDLGVGQWRSGSTYRLYQTFLDFGYTAASDAVPVTATFVLTGISSAATNVKRSIEFRQYNWGGTITTGNWRTPSQLNSATLLASTQKGERISNKVAFAGLSNVTLMDTNQSPLRCVVVSERNRRQQTPTTDERNFFHAHESVGTANDPHLVVGSVTQHLLNRTLGAQCQLSDGSHLYLDIDQVSGNIFTVSIYRNDGTSSTLVDSFITTGESAAGENIRGAQAYCLTRDASDNFYLINPYVGNVNQINCRAWKKGTGWAWTRGKLMRASVREDNAKITNIVAAWHSVGSGGTLVVQCMREWGRADAGASDPYLILNPSALLNGSGTLVRATGRAGDVGLIPWPSHVGWLSYVNQTSTMLDICAAPGSTNRGYLITAERNLLLGQNGPLAIGRYQLNSNGTGFANVVSSMMEDAGYGTKDPDSKCRVIGISATEFAVISVNSQAGTGITVRKIKNASTDPNLNPISTSELGSENLASMPLEVGLAVSSAWDAMYNPVDNSIWVYYFDANDDQRLLRTRVSMETGLADQIELEVSDSVGAVGSTNHAIRVHRGPSVAPQAIVSVANETSDGTHSMIYLADKVNAAPTQPVLVTHPNFDADNTQNFQWTFVDPDPTDTQSAYQFQADNLTDGVSAIDTGKVASSSDTYTVNGGTLANDKDYRWRVKVWDASDIESPWSDWGFFTTSNSGVVTIIDPAVDNDPEIFVKDYLIEWIVDETVPDEYRVVVTRTSDGSVLQDSGWVTSQNTTYQINDMLSDVEYKVEVTVRSSMVASNTAVRYITPDYDTPEIPEVSVQVSDDGSFVLVELTNPESQGDRPFPDFNKVYRRERDKGGRFRYLGDAEPNGTFKDFTAASGVVYEYKARAGVTS